MGKLPPPDSDNVRVNVRPTRHGAPWVRLYLHRYPGDKNGEPIGNVNLESGRSRDELALELGRMVLDGSPYARAWLDRQGTGGGGQNP